MVDDSRPDAEPLDALVVGGGPAGLTAGLYLRRFHREVMLVDDGRSRTLGIDRTHNFPGFPEGIAGGELLERMRRQFRSFGGCVTEGRVESLTRNAQTGLFEAVSADRTLTARTVLLATGVVDTRPALPGVDEVLRAGRLRQCPICDGHEYRDRRIAVIGDGPHAEREAVFIGHFSNAVLLVGLNDAPAIGTTLPVRRSREAAQRLAMTDAGAVAVELRDGSRVTVDVVYAALGSRPRVELVATLGARQDAGQALFTDAHGLTSVPDLYAAGDVVSALDQISVAIGHGAAAATAIHNRLASAARQGHGPAA